MRSLLTFQITSPKELPDPVDLNCEYKEDDKKEEIQEEVSHPDGKVKIFF